MNRTRIMIATTIAAIMVAVVAVGAHAMLRSEPFRFSALFESTVGLYPGSDVQMLGVPVGTVTAVTPIGEAVRVDMELDEGHHAAADTAAVIIAPTLVSDRFVQLTQPWVDGDAGQAMAAGTQLGLERTAVPVEIDELYAGLQDISDALGPAGANRDGALSDLLEVAAANLGGMGEGLNQMFREFGKASATLAGIDEDLFATITNFDELSQMLVDYDHAVGTVNQQFAEVAAYLAEDRDDLGRAARNLSAAMAVVDDFIRDNRKQLHTSVDNLLPLTKSLHKQRKSLDETVRLMPLLMHNLLDLYDPVNNVLIGRGNLNEATIWADALTARSSATAPPTMFDGDEGSTR